MIADTENKEIYDLRSYGVTKFYEINSDLFENVT